MDFSEAYKSSGLPPSISPDGRYLAHTVDTRLVIRDVETLGVVQLYSCLDNIASFAWSPDSMYVLCVLDGRGVVQVWSVMLGDWTCKVDEGPAGVIDARWAPDSRHIVTCADFNLRLSVWSLQDKSYVHISSPKFPAAGVSFSPDGRVMAVGHRKQCKDSVALVSTSTWAELQRFKVPTQDMAGVAFSPNGAHVAAWDSPLHNRVVVSTVDGTLVAQLDGEDYGLGVTGVQWSPSGAFLAVGQHRGVVRVLESGAWGVAAEFDHPDTVESPATCVVYMEETDGAGDERSRFAVASVPVALPDVGGEGNGRGGGAGGRGTKGADVSAKGVASVGVSKVAFSPCGSYLATVDGNAGGAAWVWSMGTLQLVSVVNLKRPIQSLAWSPVSARTQRAGDASLCLLNGGPKLYVWTPEGASCVHVPLPNFRPHEGSYGADGATLALGDQRALCCAYLGA